MPLALSLLLLLPLLSSLHAHVCIHDKYIKQLKPAVQAPASDGARRAADASVAPLRIAALYAASNGGTDIASEQGMTLALKAVVTTAVQAALARFSQLLRVAPVEGALYAYRQCTEQWANGACSAVTLEPQCGGGGDDVALPLGAMLGRQVYYPASSTRAAVLPATGAGVPSADTAIFVTTKQTSYCGSGTLAYASGCQRASNDRPTFGHINFCPDMIPPSVTDAGYEDFYATALHELTHILAFSSSLFPYFRDDLGVARTPRDNFGYVSDDYYSYSRGSSVSSAATISYANERGMDCSWGSATSWAAANIPYGRDGKAPGNCVARLSTPRVRAATQAFFNCAALQGAELENQDTSDGFEQGSHWEARSLASEFMAAYSFPGSKISAITLATFEDSGWYKAAYANGDAWVEGRDWGYKQGCAFAQDKCSATNVGTPPHFYFGSPDADKTLCSVDRSAPASSSTRIYPTLLPAQYRYFLSSNRKGGTDPTYDYCPAVTGSTSPSWMCSTTTASARYGETVGAGSKCHVSTLNSLGATPSVELGGCYRVTCAPNGLSYALQVGEGATAATATCTAHGALAQVAGHSGAIVCGSPTALCGRGEVWVPPCSAGSGVDPGTQVCAACAAGWSSAGGVGAVCVACEAGYSSEAGASQCTLVPPSASATPTPTGTQSPTPSLTPGASPSTTPTPTPTAPPTSTTAPAPATAPSAASAATPAAAAALTLLLQGLPDGAVEGRALTLPAYTAILTALQRAVGAVCAACSVSVTGVGSGGGGGGGGEQLLLPAPSQKPGAALFGSVLYSSAAGSAAAVRALGAGPLSLLVSFTVTAAAAPAAAAGLATALASASFVSAVSEQLSVAGFPGVSVAVVNQPAAIAASSPLPPPAAAAAPLDLFIGAPVGAALVICAAVGGYCYWLSRRPKRAPVAPPPPPPGQVQERPYVQPPPPSSAPIQLRILAV